MRTTVVGAREPTRLSVDFPRQYERVTSSQYTLRVTAPEGVKKVEVRVDDGDWQPCRYAVGYWWHDWSGYSNGDHDITARITTQEGKVITAEPHEIVVDLSPHEAEANA